MLVWGHNAGNMRTRVVSASVVVTGAAVFLYALLYVGMFLLASAVVSMSNVQQVVFFSLVALLPASVVVVLGYRWAQFAVAALLIPGLALTVGGVAHTRNAGDLVLTAILLGVPLTCLVVIVRRLSSRSN